MITPESQATIEALSDVDLEHEINLGARSRYQGEKFAYLQTEKGRRDSDKVDRQQKDEQEQKRREFRLTRLTGYTAIICSLLTLVGGGGWYQEHQKTLKAEAEAKQRVVEADQLLVVEYLQPIADLLNRPGFRGGRLV